jgi:polyisoprenoid-binding protein YceI
MYIVEFSTIIRIRSFTMSTDTIATEIKNGIIPAGKWSIDTSHSEIGFTVRHLVFSKVRGSFEKFSGVITVSEDITQSSVEVEIEAGSINTRDENRDNHLRSADFFDAEKFPSIVFIAEGLTLVKDNKYILNGNLKMRDIVKPVSLDVEFNGAGKDPYGNSKASFSATGSFKRSDWGMEWNAALEAGGFLVSDLVELNLEIQAMLQA